MSTMGLIKNPRQRGLKKVKSPALQGCPQQRAIVKKSFITTPRKPNSAKRKVAKVAICRTRKIIDIYLEGMDFNKLNPHSVVLVRGRGPRDTPGVNYHAIRGKGDFPALLNRRKGRSKYGARQPKVGDQKSNKKATSSDQSGAISRIEKLNRQRFLMYGFKLNSRPARNRFG